MNDHELLLQEDDCAPDSIECFNQEFKEITGHSMPVFMRAATRTDGEMELRWSLGNYCLVHAADDPYYRLYMRYTRVCV